MNRFLTFLTVALLLGPMAGDVALAHKCGPSEITIPFNRMGSYRIKADVSETEPSQYQIVGPPNPAILQVVPADPYNEYHYGEWTLIPQGLGTTIVDFRWDYFPAPAWDFCFLTVHVVAEDLTPKTTHDEQHTGSTDEPTNMLTGEFWHEETPDLSLPNGNMPIEFTRSYGSRRNEMGQPQGGLGINWSHNFERRLVKAGNTVFVHMSQGRELKFTEGTGGFTLDYPPDVPYQMRRIGSEIAVLDPTEERRYFFEDQDVGRFTKVKDRNDNTITVVYGNGGQGRNPVELVGDTGQKITINYQSFQLISSVTDGTRTVQYAYQGAFPDDWLWTVTDPESQTTTYEYADSFTYGPGRLTGILRPEGNRRYTQTYNTDGTVNTQQDADMHTWTMQYLGGANRFAAPGGAWFEHVHDATGQLTEVVDTGGQTWTYEYDGSGRKTGHIPPGLPVTQVSHDPVSGKIAQIIDRRGQVWTYDYVTTTDPDGFQYRDLQQTSYPDGGLDRYEYDANGNLTKLTDTRNNETTYTYDPTGSMLTQTNAATGVVTYTYDTQGNPATRTESGGGVTTYSYDSLNRLTTITHDDLTTRQYTYDGNDRILELRNENNELTVHTYDQNGNLVQKTDPLNQITTYDYDGNDRLTQVTDRVNRVAIRAYDAQGNIDFDQDGSGNATTYSYDARGNLIGVLDAESNSTSIAYDVLGNPIAINDGQLVQTQYTYDPEGNVLERIRPSGARTTFDYDAVGRCTEAVDPVGRVTRWIFDPEGNTTVVELPGSNQQITIDYTALNRPLMFTDGNTNATTYEYDDHGRLTAQTDALSNRTEYSWNNRELLSQITLPDLSTQTYTYDPAGRITQRAYSAGPLTLNQGYDAAGRLTNVQGGTYGYDAEGNLVSANGLTIDRNHPQSEITGMTYDTGKQVIYSYDAAGRLSSVSDWSGGGPVTYTYDALSRRTGAQLPNTCDVAYTYDTDGLLERCQDTCGAQPLIDIQLTRNPAGDVISVDRTTPFLTLPAPASETFTYDALDRRSGSSYDVNGNWTGDGTWSCSWDAANRLTSCSGPQTGTYGHNGFGQLTSVSDGTATWGITWNAGMGVPGASVVSLDGSPVWFNVHDNRGHLQYRIDAATSDRQFYHFDELGNTLALTDELGNTVCSYSYTPGGCTQKTGTCDNLFTYRGHYSVVADPVVDGVFHQGSRVYHCDQQRYLNPNPLTRVLAHPNSASPYVASAANPNLNTNPFGLTPQGESNLGTGLAALGTVGALTDHVGGNTARTLEHSLTVIRAVAKNPGVSDPRLNASGLRQAMDNVVDAGRNNQLASGKGAKLLSGAGTVATYAGIGLEIFKLDKNLEQASANYDRNVRQAFDTARLQIRNAWRSYEAKNITLPTLKLRIGTAQRHLELALFHAGWDYEIDALTSFWAAWGNIWGGKYLPGFGLVTPTFQHPSDIENSRRQAREQRRNRR